MRGYRNRFGRERVCGRGTPARFAGTATLVWLGRGERLAPGNHLRGSGRAQPRSQIFFLGRPIGVNRPFTSRLDEASGLDFLSMFVFGFRVSRLPCF